MVSRKSRLKIIPIAKPFFCQKEERLVSAVIRSGWIGQGKVTEEFEKKACDYLGAKHAVAASSGTAALHMALLIAGIGPGDEVIVPPFSFIATANSVLYCGARPVFIDIDPLTYNIDPLKIEAFLKASCRYDAKRKAYINKRTRGILKAIMPVHQFGLPCELDSISRIAKKYGLAMVEDAACALGSRYKNKKIGSRSRLACFSFHPRKILTTGEGGLLVTNESSYAEKASALRNHGLSVSGQGDIFKKSTREDYGMLGFNYRITDMQAALGIAQIAALDKIIADRKRLAERYNSALDAEGMITLPFIPHYAESNYQSYVIYINGCPRPLRDKVIASLSKIGICSRRGNTAIHLQSLYKSPGVKLANTLKASESTLALPMYYKMTDGEQDRVIEKLIFVLRKLL